MVVVVVVVVVVAVAIEEAGIEAAVAAAVAEVAVVPHYAQITRSRSLVSLLKSNRVVCTK